jgi:hypothetical protein
VLDTAGIRAVLLKGPSFARWLYPEDSARPYIDTDLLVADTDFAPASEALGRLGFRVHRPGWRDRSLSWLRARDDAWVDLHRSLVGVESTPDRLWDAVTADTETLRVGDRDVEILGLTARLAHVALHAAQHGADQIPQPLEDLSRALALHDDAEWRDAAGLAERLDALPAFATGLRMDPKGDRVAARLHLPIERPPGVALHAEPSQPLVRGFEYLAVERDARARLRFLARKLAPPPRYLRGRSALARRGALGLGLAYLAHPIGLLGRAPVGIVAWRRARRAVAAESEVDGPKHEDRE